MPDWTKSMQQKFEYYIVDPITWKDVKPINNVKSCTIERDVNTDTLGSATIDIDELIGECYIRVYLITIQKGVTEKHPLGTFLIQTPSSSFDGKVRGYSMDAYTPLLELKDNQPPLGYSLLKGENIMERAYQIVREHVRAPVVETKCTTILYSDFVSDPSEKWISFVRDLVANAKYDLDLDELGRVLFSPKQDITSLQPVWTYKDDNSSILYPDISWDHDLYGIPNIVEVLYSSGRDSYHAVVKNDDPNSPTSIVNRGREIIHRVTEPELIGNVGNKQVQEYAERLLQELSTLEHTISYTHGYCPVRINQCVRLNYSRAGLSGIKAKVISQSIKCEPGCPVTEKAVYPNKLWR